MSNQFPCKECIVKVVCEEPCDKVENLKNKISNREICLFCGSELKDSFCKHCNIRDYLLYGNGNWFNYTS